MSVADLVSRETHRRLGAFIAMVGRWNPRINLVSRADLAELSERHVQDSLQLLALLPPKKADAADLGSGGGFPGLVLALAEPDRRWHLIDSDRRKAAFLTAAAGELGITNVVVHARRIEQTSLTGLGVVTARALAPLPGLLSHAHRLLARDGIAIFPKGRGVEAEIALAEQEWTMLVERFPSETDPEATILRVNGLRPADG